jgi:PAS domain S-box-containing protein
MTTRVRLEGFPVSLFEAFDEATEGLLREYFMVAAGGGQAYSTEDVGAAGEAKHLVAHAARNRSGRIDLELTLSAAQCAAFPLMQGVLDHANRLARSAELLSLPVLPEIGAFRNWMCDQVITQASGGDVAPWRLPRQPEEPGAAPATWPGMASLPDDEPWLVGDDANRIIGASTAALTLLGWHSLVGERILAVIPPHFREQHIAAFTRGVVTDEHHLLDRPLELAALTADGRTIPVTLTLTRHDAQGDRTVYLARIAAR